MEERTMKIIDVTFDFETVGRGADAAPMQLAAVAWYREEMGSHPFIGHVFNQGIDLRTCVMKGLKFDQNTIDWWSKQSKSAQSAVLNRYGNDLSSVIEDFISWVLELKTAYGAETVCLWCQGMDFDVPILKHCCRIANIDIDKKINYQHFCDARSFVLQGLQVLYPDKVDMANPKLAYNLLPSMDDMNRDSLPEDMQAACEPHDALYDCMRSTWNVWQVMKKLSKSEA